MNENMQFQTEIASDFNWKITILRLNLNVSRAKSREFRVRKSFCIDLFIDIWACKNSDIEICAN